MKLWNRSRLRAAALVVGTFSNLTACVVTSSSANNGAEKKFEFTVSDFASTANAGAVGTTLSIIVQRSVGSTDFCGPGAGGVPCGGASLVPINLIDVNCGAQCDAQIDSSDVNFAKVTMQAHAAGEFTLTVNARAKEGAGQWRDEYRIPMASVDHLALKSSLPLGYGFATDVGTIEQLVVVPVDAHGNDLAGAFATSTTADSFLSVRNAATCTSVAANSAPISEENCLFVSANGVGSGDLSVTALGLTRTIPFRVVDPSSWTAVEFHRTDSTTSFSEAHSPPVDVIGAAITSIDLSVATGFQPVDAVSRLADGSSVLVQASRIECGPQSVVSTSPAGEQGGTDNTSAWKLFLNTDADPNATGSCVVRGSELLGTLGVHVIE